MALDIIGETGDGAILPTDRSRVAVIISRQRLIGSTNGSSTYLLAITQTLKSVGFVVHLIQPSPAIAGRTPFIRLMPEMEMFATHKIRGAVEFGRTRVFTSPGTWFAAFIGVVRRLARRAGVTAHWSVERQAAYSVATPWTPTDLSFTLEAMPLYTDLVIADYAFCVPGLAAAPAGARTAILMHDLFHLRDGKGEDSVTLLSRDEETEMLGRADAVLAIQANEQAFVRNHVVATEAVLAPMPAHPVSDPQPGQNGQILFVGSLTAPNIVGLRWFLAQVWPQVRAAHPSTQLCVAGTVGRAFPEPMDGVQFAGLIPNLSAAYHKAGIVISPLTFGSGLKIKLIEAMAKGKAVIATPVTLQGVEEACKNSVWCAEAPSDFANAILTLIDDVAERRRFGEAALQTVKQHFAVGPAHRELRAWLQNPSLNE